MLNTSRAALLGGLAIGLAGLAGATPPGPERPSVQWAASWDAAVAEASARHVPIFVSFHKDN